MANSKKKKLKVLKALLSLYLPSISYTIKYLNGLNSPKRARLLKTYKTTKKLLKYSINRGNVKACRRVLRTVTKLGKLILRNVPQLLVAHSLNILTYKIATGSWRSLGKSSNLLKKFNRNKSIKLPKKPEKTMEPKKCSTLYKNSPLCPANSKLGSEELHQERQSSNVGKISQLKPSPLTNHKTWLNNQQCVPPNKLKEQPLDYHQSLRAKLLNEISTVHKVGFSSGGALRVLMNRSKPPFQKSNPDSLKINHTNRSTSEIQQTVKNMQSNTLSFQKNQKPSLCISENKGKKITKSENVSEVEKTFPEKKITSTPKKIESPRVISKKCTIHSPHRCKKKSLQEIQCKSSNLQQNSLSRNKVHLSYKKKGHRDVATNSKGKINVTSTKVKVMSQKNMCSSLKTNTSSILSKNTFPIRNVLNFDASISKNNKNAEKIVKCLQENTKVSLDPKTKASTDSYKQTKVQNSSIQKPDVTKHSTNNVSKFHKTPLEMKKAKDEQNNKILPRKLFDKDHEERKNEKKEIMNLSKSTNKGEGKTNLQLSEIYKNKESEHDKTIFVKGGIVNGQNDKRSHKIESKSNVTSINSKEKSLKASSTTPKRQFTKTSCVSNDTDGINQNMKINNLVLNIDKKEREIKASTGLSKSMEEVTGIKSKLSASVLPPKNLDAKVDCINSKKAASVNISEVKMENMSDSDSLLKFFPIINIDKLKDADKLGRIDFEHLSTNLYDAFMQKLKIPEIIRDIIPKYLREAFTAKQMLAPKHSSEYYFFLDEKSKSRERKMKVRTGDGSETNFFTPPRTLRSKSYLDVTNKNIHTWFIANMREKAEPFNLFDFLPVISADKLMAINSISSLSLMDLSPALYHSYIHRIRIPKVIFDMIPDHLQQFYKFVRVKRSLNKTVEQNTFVNHSNISIKLETMKTADINANKSYKNSLPDISGKLMRNNLNRRISKNTRDKNTEEKTLKSIGGMNKEFNEKDSKCNVEELQVCVIKSDTNRLRSGSRSNTYVKDKINTGSGVSNKLLLIDNSFLEGKDVKNNDKRTDVRNKKNSKAVKNNKKAVVSEKICTELEVNFELNKNPSIQNHPNKDVNEGNLLVDHINDGPEYPNCKFGIRKKIEESQEDGVFHGQYQEEIKDELCESEVFPAIEIKYELCESKVFPAKEIKENLSEDQVFPEKDVLSVEHVTVPHGNSDVKGKEETTSSELCDTKLPPKRSRELDRLHEDIRTMFISKDVVTAYGARKCASKTLAALHDNYKIKVGSNKIDSLKYPSKNESQLRKVKDKINNSASRSTSKLNIGGKKPKKPLPKKNIKVKKNKQLQKNLKELESSDILTLNSSIAESPLTSNIVIMEHAQDGLGNSNTVSSSMQNSYKDSTEGVLGKASDLYIDACPSSLEIETKKSGNQEITKIIREACTSTMESVPSCSKANPSNLTLNILHDEVEEIEKPNGTKYSPVINDGKKRDQNILLQEASVCVGNDDTLNCQSRKNPITLYEAARQHILKHIEFEASHILDIIVRTTHLPPINVENKNKFARDPNLSVPDAINKEMVKLIKPSNLTGHTSRAEFCEEEYKKRLELHYHKFGLLFPLPHVGDIVQGSSNAASNLLSRNIENDFDPTKTDKTSSLEDEIHKELKEMTFLGGRNVSGNHISVVGNSSKCVSALNSETSNTEPHSRKGNNGSNFENIDSVVPNTSTNMINENDSSDASGEEGTNENSDKVICFNKFQQSPTRYSLRNKLENRNIFTIPDREVKISTDLMSTCIEEKKNENDRIVENKEKLELDILTDKEIDEELEKISNTHSDIGLDLLSDTSIEEELEKQNMLNDNTNLKSSTLVNEQINIDDIEMIYIDSLDDLRNKSIRDIIAEQKAKEEIEKIIGSSCNTRLNFPSDNEFQSEKDEGLEMMDRHGMSESSNTINFNLPKLDEEIEKLRDISRPTDSKVLSTHVKMDKGKGPENVGPSSRNESTFSSEFSSDGNQSMNQYLMNDAKLECSDNIFENPLIEFLETKMKQAKICKMKDIEPKMYTFIKNHSSRIKELKESAQVELISFGCENRNHNFFDPSEIITYNIKTDVHTFLEDFTEPLQNDDTIYGSEVLAKVGPFRVIHVRFGLAYMCTVDGCMFNTADNKTIVQHVETYHTDRSENWFCSVCDVIRLSNLYEGAETDLLQAIHHLTTVHNIETAKISEDFWETHGIQEDAESSKVNRNMEMEDISFQDEELNSPYSKEHNPLNFNKAIEEEKCINSAVRAIQRRTDKFSYSESLPKHSLCEQYDNESIVGEVDKEIEELSELVIKDITSLNPSCSESVNSKRNNKKKCSENEVKCSNCPLWINSIEDQKENLFRCSGINCDFTTNCCDEAISHYEYHALLPSDVSDTKWKCCSYCELELEDGSTYVDHVCTQHGIPIYKCNCCLYCSVAFTNMLVHQKTNGHPGNFLVEIYPLGNIVSSSNETLNTISIIPFKCGAKFCNMETYVTRKFMEHLKSHDDCELFHCALCKAVVHNPFQMIEHCEEHKLNLFQCLYCSYGNNNVEKVQEHLSEQHPEKDPKVVLRTEYNEDFCRVLTKHYKCKVNCIETKIEKLTLIEFEDEKNGLVELPQSLSSIRPPLSTQEIKEEVKSSNKEEINNGLNLKKVLTRNFRGKISCPDSKVEQPTLIESPLSEKQNMSKIPDVYLSLSTIKTSSPTEENEEEAQNLPKEEIENEFDLNKVKTELSESEPNAQNNGCVYNVIDNWDDDWKWNSHIELPFVSPEELESDGDGDCYIDPADDVPIKIENNSPKQYNFTEYDTDNEYFNTDENVNNFCGEECASEEVIEGYNVVHDERFMDVDRVQSTLSAGIILEIKRNTRNAYKNSNLYIDIFPLDDGFQKKGRVKKESKKTENNNIPPAQKRKKVERKTKQRKTKKLKANLNKNICPQESRPEVHDRPTPVTSSENIVDISKSKLSQEHKKNRNRSKKNDEKEKKFIANKFQCGTCDLEMKTVPRLQDHCMRAHDTFNSRFQILEIEDTEHIKFLNNLYICFWCSCVLEDKAEADLHHKDIHGHMSYDPILVTKHFLCPVCDFFSLTEDDLKVHCQKSHKVIFHCPACNLSSDFKFNDIIEHCKSPQGSHEPTNVDVLWADKKMQFLDEKMKVLYSAQFTLEKRKRKASMNLKNDLENMKESSNLPHSASPKRRRSERLSLRRDSNKGETTSSGQPHKSTKCSVKEENSTNNSIIIHGRKKIIRKTLNTRGNICKTKFNLICLVCNFEASKMPELFGHISDCHPNSGYLYKCNGIKNIHTLPNISKMCYWCSEICASDISIYSHYEQFHATNDFIYVEQRKQYNCPVCPFKDEREDFVINHIKDDENHYVVFCCEDCDLFNCVDYSRVIEHCTSPQNHKPSKIIVLCESEKNKHLMNNIQITFAALKQDISLKNNFYLINRLPQTARKSTAAIKYKKETPSGQKRGTKKKLNVGKLK